MPAPINFSRLQAHAPGKVALLFSGGKDLRALIELSYFPRRARRLPLGVCQSGPCGHSRRSIKYKPSSDAFDSGGI